MVLRVKIRSLATLVVFSGVIACSGESPDSAAAAQARGSATASGAVQRGKGGTGGTQPGGRPTPTVTLAATDVATVGRDTIEAGIPITGDLNPVQTISVRSRIEGDLTDVYVREGQHVSSGQVLARFDASTQDSDKQSAEADVASARTDLATAQWNFDQSQQLFKAGAIAERDLKVAQQTVAAAKARLAATDARLRQTSNASRDTRVVAPTNGIISHRQVAGGEHVTRGAELFTLVKNNVLELAAAVPERQAGPVRVGQAVHFVSNGEPFDGRVARVSPTVDPATRAVTVYVQIPNVTGALKGGSFASGRVVQRTLIGVVTVPTAALRQSRDDGQPFVYRINGKSLETAPVQLGVVDERVGKAEVQSGLQVGDRVIVGNVGTLGRGMQVTVLGASDDRSGRGGATMGSRPGQAGGGKRTGR